MSELVSICSAAAGWRVVYFTGKAMEAPAESPLTDEEAFIVSPIACFALDDEGCVLPVVSEDWPSYLYPQRSDRSNPFMACQLGPGEELTDELRRLIRESAREEQKQREESRA